MTQRVKNPPVTQETQEIGSIPGLGRSPAGGSGNLLQESCLKKIPRTKRGWCAIAHGVVKSQT